ncbi:MAG: DNA repair protein RecN [Tannerella sp.]|jgi:DNA repair protein RecN (Recombination protein N)|nr:DNA repair protein RecN [Tannerella sp.]
MLKSLSIKNFILIDKLDIRFEDGFSVLTGETGAGKSIILGALALVLGQRADSKSIHDGSDKCAVEAVFDISAYPLKTFFSENDLEYDPQHCILRREILHSGKSRAFVNDSPVQLNILKLLGDRLIDVHSQHQNLLLADTHFQLNVVDVMAGTAALLHEYGAEYDRYLAITSELNGLTEKMQRTKAEEDYVRYQSEELNAARLTDGEQTDLEQELGTLSHAEEIKNALYKVAALLNGDEPCAVQMIRESCATMDSLAPHFPRAGAFAERLRTAFIDLNDLALETDVLKDDIEFNPERLEWVNRRLNTLYALQQKHHVSSVEALIACRNAFDRQLQLIDSFDEEIAALTKRQTESHRAVLDKAHEISLKRKATAEDIEQQIVRRMVMLGMPHTRFGIEFTDRPQPTSDGMDEVGFLFAANKNEPLKPVARTASGGEISRLMLCVKAMIAGYAALPAIIFDEIDTGTSGEIADRMAGIMQDLGQKMQVIAITHLPQIAAKGKAHYFVYKEDGEDRTHTRIRCLDMQEREHEIARMLSGATRTDASFANARELLHAAGITNNNSR